jgi:hypothetical protein
MQEGVLSLGSCPAGHHIRDGLKVNMAAGYAAFLPFQDQNLLLKKKAELPKRQ